MEINHLLLVPIFFLIALFYSTAGFGGGSSYLAILALSRIEFQFMRFLALICNIVVVSNGSFIFYKYKYLDFQEVFPFVIASIPLAFLGGKWKMTEDIFFILLGLTLLIAAILLWLPKPIENIEKTQLKFHEYHWLIKILIGGLIGFLSGLVGIGGGIFLAPILHFMNWNNTKKIAALSSFFILVNSLSGLIGQLTQFNQFSLQNNFSFILLLILAVFSGGQIGSRLTATKFKPLIIKRITAILILMVSLKILNDYLF